MRGRAEPGPHPGFCLEQVEGDSPASRPDSCFSSLRDSFSFRLHQIGDTFRSQSSQDKVPGSTFPRSFPLAVPPGGPRGPALLQSHQAWAPAQGVSPATGRPPAALWEVLPRCSAALHGHAPGGSRVQIHVNRIAPTATFRGTLGKTEGLHVRAKRGFRLNVSRETFQTCFR